MAGSIFTSATRSYGTNHHPSELFRSNGDGTFTECAAEVGVDASAYIKGVVAADFNNDGRPDLYLSSPQRCEFLYRNDGPQGGKTGPKAPWRFTNIAEPAGVTEPMMSFPAAAADFDNDGLPDILVTGYALTGMGDVVADYMGRPFRSEKARFFRNKGDGTFSDATKEVGLDKLIFAMSLNFGDYDNDGWLDFLAGTGDPDFATVVPNRAFRNAEGKRFQDVTTSGGLGHLQKGHAISFADIDNDGDQDVFEVIGGAYTDDTYHGAAEESRSRQSLADTETRRPHFQSLGARRAHQSEHADGEWRAGVLQDESSGCEFRGAHALAAEICLGRAMAIESVGDLLAYHRTDAGPSRPPMKSAVSHSVQEVKQRDPAQAWLV
ncbi:MAG: VCBS repeat-containing protein [Verrucomicrobia bacterium]|nr:VCBS repeat-containing protein [Verrucomicrobiota bacterium]